MTRYCSTCRAEVADAGGFCLLGHDLRLAAPVASLSELRAEVDRAFDDARAHVNGLLAKVDGGALEPVSPAPVAARPGAPAPRPVTPPPPPPARRTVWNDLEEAPPASHSDPIVAFAPPPRMDWGPEGARRRRRDS